MNWPKEIPEWQIDNFYRNPATTRARVKKSAVQQLLLDDDFVVARGEIWDWHHKHLGLGVYEVWLEKRVYATPTARGEQERS